jgi:ATP-dependent protease HslVU (ClpYQ) peptidase subunit
MSVVVWDGTTLAADKQGTYGDTKITVTKIRKVKLNGHVCLIGAVGCINTCNELMNWFQTGADPKTFPGEFMKDNETSASMVVIDDKRRIFSYDTGPTPFLVEDRYYATGSGKDIANAALAMKKTAKDAVALTNRLSISCGMGIDTLTF